MIRFHAPFDGKRYIGDNRLKIFHDSLFEPSPYVSGGCAIERIPAEEIRTFDPDTIGEAWRRGFVQCCYCRQGEKVIQK
jgi:hypothetical protein